jgi:hypothetical protein
LFEDFAVNYETGEIFTASKHEIEFFYFMALISVAVRYDCDKWEVSNKWNCWQQRNKTEGQAYLGHIAGSVPDHRNKASHGNFLFSQCI